jgi:hypothetical protein
MKMGGLLHTLGALTLENSHQYELNGKRYVFQVTIWKLWK